MTNYNLTVVCRYCAINLWSLANITLAIGARYVADAYPNHTLEALTCGVFVCWYLWFRCSTSFFLVSSVLLVLNVLVWQWGQSMRPNALGRRYVTPVLMFKKERKQSVVVTPSLSLN